MAVQVIACRLAKTSYIPPREQRELRDLTHLPDQTGTGYLLEQEPYIVNILEDCNVKLSSVLSDTSGVTATRLIDKLCQGKEVTMGDIVEEVYHKR